MTLHQPFYELAKQNLTELYNIWSVAALLIIAIIITFIWLSRPRYKRYCNFCVRKMKPFHKHKIKVSMGTEILGTKHSIKFKPIYYATSVIKNSF